MGDSENSNNDDNDKDDHNESGSIFGKTMFCLIQSQQNRDTGEPAGQETAYNELQLLPPFSDDLTAVAEPLNHLSNICSGTNPYFYQKERKTK